MLHEQHVHKKICSKNSICTNLDVQNTRRPTRTGGLGEPVLSQDFLPARRLQTDQKVWEDNLDLSKKTPFP